MSSMLEGYVNFYYRMIFFLLFSKNHIMNAYFMFIVYSPIKGLQGAYTCLQTIDYNNEN
jgi:hypothetical protein